MIKVKMIINGTVIANLRDMLFLHDIKIATRITFNRMESRMLSAIEKRNMSQLLDGERLFSLTFKVGTRVECALLKE
ncbi:adenosine deaminase [Aliivibrio fischeri]|nr:adenosine deaminase [Aliivibrio fischeri]OEE11500.1 adenosine deaminase [Aliivibrio fischeri ZF-211]